ILLVFGLLGDMLINAYYFAMSVYGWFVWTRKVDATHFIPITEATSKENRKSLILFIAAVIFVCAVYHIFDKFDSWTAYVDTLTTAIFFVGMWLMAKKKLENWVYWIIGDIISVPLYWYKGLIFTSLQYFLFTIIAIYGYLAWKKSLNKSPQTLLK
ncbi:MAG TPA: nicotinamide riboside transporter PnuC, partial [Pricia sp.]|nr:nicotinamide riboside transporter PnuC [Pricia sp.]